MSSLKTSLSIEQIKDSFSQGAANYDLYTAFHRGLADELLEKAQESSLPVTSILDIGCGTGYLTHKAKIVFPDAQVTGLDFAQGMLTYAQQKYPGITWILADANQLSIQEASLDLIVSNAAFQWLRDLRKVFRDTRRLLKDKGQLYVTFFGNQTCQELFNSLQAAGYPTENLNRFATFEDVQEALAGAGFSDFKIEEQVIKKPFLNLEQLLFWLKAIGANRLTSGVFLGSKTLKKANSYCLEKYPMDQGVGISFQIIKLQATR